MYIYFDFADADVEFMMNEHRYKEDIVNAISLVWSRQGSTNTANALTMMTEDMFNSAAGARPTKSDIAIVITDGHSVDRYEIAFSDLIDFSTE